jgi:phage terminase small subunit
MPKKKELTVKEKKFIKEYVKEGNGTQAVLKAGYQTTPEVARSIASENLAKPHIKERIERALANLDLSPDYTLNGFKELHETTKKKNPMASIRALENIASVQDLYPKNKTDLELSDGKLSISWEQ